MNEREVACDKDPRGCWRVRCQLGKKCVAPMERISNEQREAIVRDALAKRDALLNPAAQPVAAPIAYALQWPGDNRLNLGTVFDTHDEAVRYVEHCSQGVTVVPLFAHAAALTPPAETP